MSCKTASGFKSALIITATLLAPALSNPSRAMAETREVAQNIDAETVAAAEQLLQVMRMKTVLQPLIATLAERLKLAAAADPALRNTRIDVRKLALQLGHEREDALLTDVAKYYATRFTADELRAASAFYGSEAGTLFLEFNREKPASPATRESASAAFVSRFTVNQRAVIVGYLGSAVGQKFARLMPELKAKTGQIAGEWGLKIGYDIERSIRSGQPATLSQVKWSYAGLPASASNRPTPEI